MSSANEAAAEIVKSVNQELSDERSPYKVYATYPKETDETEEIMLVVLRDAQE